jgi:hypothetical protein
LPLSNRQIFNAGMLNRLNIFLNHKNLLLIHQKLAGFPEDRVVRIERFAAEFTAKNFGFRFVRDVD